MTGTYYSSLHRRCIGRQHTPYYSQIHACMHALHCTIHSFLDLAPQGMPCRRAHPVMTMHGICLGLMVHCMVWCARACHSKLATCKAQSTIVHCAKLGLT